LPAAELLETAGAGVEPLVFSALAVPRSWLIIAEIKLCERPASLSAKMSLAERLYLEVELLTNASTTSSLTPDWASLNTSAPGPEIGALGGAAFEAPLVTVAAAAESFAGTVLLGPMLVWAQADKTDAAAAADIIIR
jgi:hypothetical protein